MKRRFPKKKLMSWLSFLEPDYEQRSSTDKHNKFLVTNTVGKIESGSIYIGAFVKKSQIIRVKIEMANHSPSANISNHLQRRSALETQRKTKKKGTFKKEKSLKQNCLTG